MVLSDKMLRELGYVTASPYRMKVMKALEGKVLIPSHIARISSIRPNHVSKVLGDLKEHGLAECINPDVRKGKLYRLTDKGNKIVKNLEF